MRDLPAIIIGLVMGAYWARVLKLAWKQKKQTGSAGNLLPPEPLGRWLRLIWFPVIFAWIIVPLLWGFGLSGEVSVLRPMVTVPVILTWGTLAVGLAAFVATLICWKKMGKSWRMGINPDDTTQLVVSGPYARLRHPIYALSSLLMICTMIIVPSPAMLVVGLLHLALLQWEAIREERYLVSVHGDAYSDYARRTGRFVPRFWVRAWFW